MIDFKVDKISNFCLLDANTSEPIISFDNVYDATLETEVEPSSLSKEVLSLKNKASFECELIDASPLLGCAANNFYEPFDIEYQMPIMIQARWHKKHRINKKWLKRYGMKKDSILVKAKASHITYYTERENKYEIEWNMDVEDMQYHFRPDQLRNNLKIEYTL